MTCTTKAVTKSRTRIGNLILGITMAKKAEMIHGRTNILAAAAMKPVPSGRTPAPSKYSPRNAANGARPRSGRQLRNSFIAHLCFFRDGLVAPGEPGGDGEEGQGGEAHGLDDA